MIYPYTVLQANSSSGDYEADKAYVKLVTLKNVYKLTSHTFHVYLGNLIPELEITNPT